jgi:hypothetical protein
LFRSRLEWERESTTSPATITANPTGASAAPEAVSWSCSSKAKTPSAMLATGSSDIWVAGAGARAPVWSAAELTVVPAQRAAASA